MTARAASQEPELPSGGWRLQLPVPLLRARFLGISGGSIQLERWRWPAVLVVFGLLVVGEALPRAHHGQRRVRRPVAGHRRQLPDALLRLLLVMIATITQQARQDGQGSQGQHGRRDGARRHHPSQRRRGDQHGAQEQQRRRRRGQAHQGTKQRQTSQEDEEAGERQERGSHGGGAPLLAVATLRHGFDHRSDDN
ncbi:hypothetical protein SORBI_3008G192200 [Sorghum bicolor]|uniref:Uncharacterized protein n=1 Tax=Sorghum bicolor TaxID=4558 RepID=A0A1B6PEP2_SORBI|nr:hypothetical protein SORBI_3008G192200 [Sorghum bicolor]